MNAFQIKLIAVLTMVIDHIGLFFFPVAILPRVIGRLSFPLFAWLIGNGAHHTRNARNYLIRIFLLAVISQAPFIAANRLIDNSFQDLNVVFTLFLGLAAIELIKTTQKKFLWVIIAALSAAIAQLLHTNYGAVGVISIIIFYIFYNRLNKMVIWQTLNFALFYLIPVIIKLHSGGIISSADIFSISGMFGLTSLFFIALYNQKQGLKAKYLFYVFYPLQYIIIYLLKLYIF